MSNQKPYPSNQPNQQYPAPPQNPYQPQTGQAYPPQAGPSYQQAGQPYPSYPTSPQDPGQQMPAWREDSLIPQDDRTAAALAHGSTLIAMVVSAGSLSFVGPLVIWFLYKDRSPYVRHAAAGAFNFNIWLTIASIIGWVLVITVVLSPVGFGILLVTAIMQIWSHLRATLRSLKGENYRYPFETRILS